jgi:hypothetical protein
MASQDQAVSVAGTDEIEVEVPAPAELRHFEDPYVAVSAAWHLALDEAGGAFTTMYRA